MVSLDGWFQKLTYMNNKKDRLIFIQGNLYPYKIGGHEVFNHHLYKELRNNFDIKILSYYNKPNQIFKTDYLRVKSYKPLAFFFPILTFIKLISQLKYNPIVILTFSRSSWLNWWPYPILKKLFNLKYIIIIHGGGLTRWRWKYPFLKLFNSANKVIGISERICNEYNKRTGVDIKEIFPLIPFKKSDKDKDIIRKKWGIQKSEKVFLIVGSIKPLKNPKTVISAAKHLGYKFLKAHKIKFVFAGDGILLDEIKADIFDTEFEQYFNFLGNIPRESMPEIYAFSDVYIISSDFEGTPISLLEAMFNKLSIVAADSPGINDIIKDNLNGLLFEPKNSLHLANTIKKALIKNNLLIDNASKLVNSRYNYDKMINEYEIIFRET